MNAKMRVRCFTLGDTCYYLLSNGVVLRVYADEVGFGYLKTWESIREYAEIVPYVGY